MTKDTAFPVLHFISHFKGIAFKGIGVFLDFMLSGGLHPKIAALLLRPIGYRKLAIHVPADALSIPSAKDLLARRDLA